MATTIKNVPESLHFDEFFKIEMSQCSFRVGMLLIAGTVGDAVSRETSDGAVQSDTIGNGGVFSYQGRIRPHPLKNDRKFTLFVNSHRNN